MTSRTYNLGTGTGRRRAFIINNVNFDQTVKRPFASRKYSDIDAAHLMSFLSQLRFKPQMKKDRSAEEMKVIAEQEAAAINASTEDVDCLLFVVLTYGEFGVLHGKDRAIQADDIISPFKGDKCKKLAGKPKLFIFQACNPEFYNMSRLVGHTQSDDDSQAAKKTYKIPAEADFHIVWSLVPGTIPLEKARASSASMFLGALNEVLDAELKLQRLGQPATEYNSLMTRVLGRVDEALEEYAGIKYKESEFLLPCAINMLTKALYFKREVAV